MGMMIAGMIEDEMAAQETPLEEETEPKDTMRPPKQKKEKKTRSASKPGKAKSLHARTSKRASKGSAKTISTTTRSGKKIQRAKAGGSGKLAEQGVYAMVVRVSRTTHQKMWSKIKKMKEKGPASLNSFVNSLIEKAL